MSEKIKIAGVVSNVQILSSNVLFVIEDLRITHCPNSNSKKICFECKSICSICYSQNSCYPCKGEFFLDQEDGKPKFAVKVCNSQAGFLNIADIKNRSLVIFAEGINGTEIKKVTAIEL